MQDSKIKHQIQTMTKAFKDFYIPMEQENQEV